MMVFLLKKRVDLLKNAMINGPLVNQLLLVVGVNLLCIELGSKCKRYRYAAESLI